MNRRGLVVIIGLLALVNAAVLAGVAYNRSGDPDAMVMLTEREVPLSTDPGFRENTGVSLSLNVNPDDQGESWLDEKKLAGLGFDTEQAGANERRWDSRHLPKKVFVVLEYEGPSWELFKKRRMEEIAEIDARVRRGELKVSVAEKQKEEKSFQLGVASRLFSIDAGLDPETLRQLYPDRGRYIIVPALVRMNFRKADGEDRWEAYGRVERIIVDSLHVPRALQSGLLSLDNKSRIWPGYTYYNAKHPAVVSYGARVAFGRRLEPWVQEITLKDAGISDQ